MVALAALATGTLGLGCATIHETRTQQVLDEQSVRLSEQRAPEQREYQLSPRWRAHQLDIHVDTSERCLVVFGERRRVREKIVRSHSGTTTALEIAGLGAGSVAFLYGGGKTADAGGGPPAVAFVMLAGLGLAVASGVALAVDTKLSSDYELEHTVEPVASEERMAPCSQRGSRPQRIELTTDRGRRFLSSIDGRGIAHFQLPADLWGDSPTVTLRVMVDGHSSDPLVLRQGP